jgi:hypothetical protein
MQAIAHVNRLGGLERAPLFLNSRSDVCGGLGSNALTEVFLLWNDK